MGKQKLRNDIGKRIRNLRIEFGFSQENLAEGVNMSREHISCIERGKNSLKVETLYNISLFFGVSIKYFFEDY